MEKSYRKIKKDEFKTVHCVRIQLEKCDPEGDESEKAKRRLLQFLLDFPGYTYCDRFPSQTIAISYDDEGWVVDLEAVEKTERFTDSKEEN